jgi:hypothetical protein
MIEANNAMVLLLVQGKAGLRWVPLPIDTGLAATMIVKQKG